MSENFFKLKKNCFTLTWLSHISNTAERIFLRISKDKAIFGMEGSFESFKSQWAILWEFIYKQKQTHWKANDTLNMFIWFLLNRD